MNEELYWQQFFVFWTFVELVLIFIYVAIDEHLRRKVTSYARLFRAEMPSLYVKSMASIQSTKLGDDIVESSALMPHARLRFRIPRLFS